MEGLLQTTVIEAGLYYYNAAFRVEFHNAVHMSWKYQHDTATQRRTALIGTATTGGYGNNTATFGQLPGKTGGFTDIIFVTWVNN